MRVYHKADRSIFCQQGCDLSAGAIASPAILQRSGIGEASWLRKQGIDVVVERKGVGANLQDHLGIFQIACAQPMYTSQFGLKDLNWPDG